ncbi:MAG: acyloxyacyl hydrolase [Bacteroidota bacterium]
MRLYHSFLLLSFFLGIVFAANAQNTERLTLSGKMHYGFITPHHKSITYYIEDHLPGFDFTVARVVDGSKSWHHIYKLPETGFTFYHTGLSNDAVFGRSTSMSMFIRNPLRNPARKFNLYNKFDFGLAWVTNRYDLYDNHTNLSISTHLNAFLRYSFEMEYPLTNDWKVLTGLSFGHISNGNMSNPNKGLNFITASMGVHYNFEPRARLEILENKSKEATVKVPQNKFALIFNGGVKEISHRWEGKYFCSTLILDYNPLITKRFAFGAGLDFVYDGSMKDQTAFEIQPYKRNDEYRAAFHLTSAVLVGKTSFHVQPGVYIWNHYSLFKKVSNRIGIRHQVDDHWLINVSVRIHWAAIADFVEWGIGYSW